jgi:hypothetical protein
MELSHPLAAAPRAETWDDLQNTPKKSVLQRVGNFAVQALLVGVGLAVGAIGGLIVALFAGLIEFSC